MLKRKLFGMMTLIAGIMLMFAVSACGGLDGDDSGKDKNGGDPGGSVLFTWDFTENTGWNQTGHEDWCRWHYKYTGANTSTLDSNKTYVLTASFTSNVDIETLGGQFVKEEDWVQVSDWTDVNITGDIPKNTRYNVKIPLFPKSNVSNFLYVGIGRKVTTAPVLSFYQFSLEPVNKETAGLTKWTVSGKDINVTDTKRTFAETISYQGKSNVFHIKPTYNASTYDHIVMEYDLNAYKGKKIGVEMSFDAYINKESRIAWQMLISPDYPLVCGYNDSNYFLSANTWHNISGNTIVSVPSGGGKLYLSGMQIIGAEAYFANPSLTITEGSSTPDTAVTLNSVTADGSSSSKTTQLTLTFSQAITGLTAANINLGSSISGLTKGTLSGTGPTYTLPVTGFTAGGTLSVSASKLGYNITPTKTVTIYGSGGSGNGGGGQNDPGDLAGTWKGNIGNYNAIITVSGTGWTMTATGTSFYDSGYFVRNGNTATLYLSSGTNNGTATLINSTTIQVVLNSNTIFPGTYTLTKDSSSGGGGGSNTNADVYVAGEDTIDYHPVATLWKNGVKQILSDKYSSAKSVFVSGNDVYVAGTVSGDSGDRATLWKNGVSQTLNANLSNAYSVYVSGSDVYVIGSIYVNGSRSYVLWKNGVSQTLNNFYQPTSVYVSGSNVYISGYTGSSGGGSSGDPRAALWKNGTIQTLGNEYSLADYVYGSGSDVYVVGTVGNPDDLSTIRATLWKNGTAQTLYNQKSQAYSVFVSGSDVYVAGVIKMDNYDSLYNPVLWKNGVIQKLSDRSGDTNSVYVSGTDVYVSGNRSGATYWKNGVEQTLDHAENSNSKGLSIFVVPK